MTDQNQDRLNFALDAINAAHEFILSHYQTGVAIHRKSDDSPVTIADKGAEQLLRDRIGATFADDAILGEEHEDKEGTSGYRWILDPIDGTKAFIHGVPLFGCLIGIEHEGEMVAGLCGFPAMNELIYASKGQGAWWKRGAAEPTRCEVTSTSELSDAMMSYTQITGYDDTNRTAAFERLIKATRLARGWGDCYGHMLVATGRADISVDPEMNPWDGGALLPIVTEAGGHYFGWNGEASIYTHDGISTNAMLKDAVLEVLSGS